MPDDRLAASEAGLMFGVAERLARRDFRGAVELAGFGVSLFPSSGRLWELGGLAAWADDDRTAAIATLEEAGRLVPLHPYARVALADGYEVAGYAKHAQVEWDYLNTASGGDRLLATLRPHPGADWWLAHDLFRAITDHDPGNPRGWYGVGECLGRLGAAPDRVLEPLRLAADIEPGHPVYALAAAAAWATVGRPDLGAVELRAVRLSGVICRYWLKQAEGLFEAAGDQTQATACRRRQRELGDS